MFKLFHGVSLLFCLLVYYFPSIFDLGLIHEPLSRLVMAFDTLSVCIAWDSSVRNLYTLIILLNFVMPVLWIYKSGPAKVKPGVGLLVASFFLFLYGLAQLYLGLPFGDVDGSAKFLEYLYCNFSFFSFVLIVVTGMLPMVATFSFFHVILSMAGRK
jgi:hypothetical protein